MDPSIYKTATVCGDQENRIQIIQENVLINTFQPMERIFGCGKAVLRLLLTTLHIGTAGDVTRCLGGLRKDSGNHPGITAVVQTTVGLMHGRKPVLSGQGNFTGDLLYQMSYY
jgi:hypothetical protein